MARILIADDTSFMRSTIRLYFQETHHEVVAEARDGKEAIHQCKSHRVDVVLMDLSMPDTNGFDATRQIMAQYPDTKVIICSLYNSSDEVREAYRAGASGYLIKPFSRQRLIDEVDRWFPAPVVDETTSNMEMDDEPIAQVGG